ncbi:MAG: hypothetical protein JW809_13620 [Pirellulales bacterium]|nr:hypothetical protein [Pirellulales bacterium]
MSITPLTAWAAGGASATCPTGRTPSTAAAVGASGPLGGATTSVRPGNVRREASDITTCPVAASKRTMSVNCRWGPPTSSQGRKKLYEWPRSDSL